MIRRCAAVLAGCLYASSVGGADLILRGGQVFDGSGGPGFKADVAIHGDRITAIGDLDPQTTSRVIDVEGLAIAPGFINMLSWSAESLAVDGRGLSDLKQGVTLEVFGEGRSPGPTKATGDTPRKTLMDALGDLADSGISLNITSLIGASTVREYVMGDRAAPPTAHEMTSMRTLVREAMAEGAIGVGAALIYAPGAFATTDELIALATEAAAQDALFTAHLRSEGDRLLEALDEFIRILDASGVRGEIHHLKASGRENWHKLSTAITRIEAARRAGLTVSANMYAYTRGATGLDAAMPPWVQRGSIDDWIERLQQPETRAEVRRQMAEPAEDWENLLAHSGPEGALLVGFENPELAVFTGKSLAEVARLRNQHYLDAAIDLVIEDRSEVQVVYALMSEQNLTRKLRTPWIGFGSDARALAAEPPFTDQSTHPRAYGNFARVLGRFVRDQELLSLSEAIHRMTGLAAARLGLSERGCLRVGCFADVVVFEPDRISDRATYAAPHQYAVGVRHVIVNGKPTLIDGAHTGMLAGRVIRKDRPIDE